MKDIFEPLETAEAIVGKGVIPISALTLKRFAAAGKVRAYRPGKAWLFRLSEVYADITRNFSSGRYCGADPTLKKPKGMKRALACGWR